MENKSTKNNEKNNQKNESSNEKTLKPGILVLVEKNGEIVYDTIPYEDAVKKKSDGNKTNGYEISGCI